MFEQILESIARGLERLGIPYMLIGFASSTGAWEKNRWSDLRSCGKKANHETNHSHHSSVNPRLPLLCG
jgi:hypothetical protein